MTELIDGIWNPVKPPYQNPPIDTPRPPREPEPEPGQPVILSAYIDYADSGKIVVKAILRNISGMYIKNLPVWAHLKQDISGVGARYGYLSIETKPRYINLKGTEGRTETFFFEDERIKPGCAYTATVYYEFNGKTYSYRVRVAIKYRPCTGTDFRKDKTERIDVTNIVRKYRKNVKNAVLEIYRGTAHVVKYMPPDEKGLYNMWERGFTVEKKVCPRDGKTYYVQYACKLLVYTGNERGTAPLQNSAEPAAGSAGEENEPTKEEQGIDWKYIVLGAAIAGAVLYLLRRR